MAARDDDTSRQMARAFPSTRWSRIVGTGSQASTQPDVEALALAYWRPVYGFVRARWAKTDEEALDATQDFFLWMLEGGLLAKADPARGRFRGFLKTSLRNFLNDQERKRRALKRGGDRTHVRIDLPSSDAPSVEPEWESQTPEEVLDGLWRTSLVERATQTLEEELRALGKTTYYEVFRDYFLSSEEDVDYEVVAQRYGITKAQVSNYLMQAKRRYRSLLRSAVMETVSRPEDLEEELRWLFGAGAS